MFVDSININEFRGIKCCNGPLMLSRLNILIGRNNAGKTTILDALSLLPKPDTKDSIMNKNKIDLLLDLHKSKRSNYKSLLHFYAGRSEIEYHIKNKEFSIHLTENEPELYTPNQRIQDNKPIFEIFNTTNLTNLVIYIPFYSPFIDKMEEKINELKDLINKGGYNTKIAESINICIDDKYSEIIFQERITLRKIFRDNRFNYVDLRDLGSGTEKVIKIMALVEVLKPKLLLIDDFEAGLHPSLKKVFLSWLKDKELQTVISTHSMDVLYYLIEVEPSDTTILQLKKSSEDVLNHKALTLEDLEDLLHGNLDPRILVDALDL